MNRKRIAHLIEVLKKVDEAKYNQSHYMGLVADGTPPAKLVKDDLNSPLPDKLSAPPFICHTSACALGWAAFDPEFQAEGLVWRLGADRMVWRDLIEAREIAPDQVWNVVVLGLDTQGNLIENGIKLSGDTASKAFFDLNDAQNHAIFGFGYATVAEKITQLENFLATDRVPYIFDDF